MELFRAIRRDGERKYLNEALDEILHCFEYYGIDALCLSFNGGKDCTVLLHLIRAALAGAGYTRRAMLPVVYFRGEEEFDELHAFNEHMIKTYKLEIMEYGPASMVQCLEALVRDHSNLKAIFMGQRRSDPGGQKLKRIEKCDPGWPQIDRLNTILDWTYNQVWDFLITFNLPYCRMYELGYTSLGSRLLTVPNPKLQKGSIPAANYTLPYTPYVPPSPTSTSLSGCSTTSSACGADEKCKSGSIVQAKPYLPSIPESTHAPSNSETSSSPVSVPCASLRCPELPDSLHHYMCQYYRLFDSGAKADGVSDSVSEGKSIPHTDPDRAYNTNTIEEGYVKLMTYAKPIHLSKWPFYPAFVLNHGDEFERLGRIPRTASTTAVSAPASASVPAAKGRKDSAKSHL